MPSLLLFASSYSIKEESAPKVLTFTVKLVVSYLDMD